MLKMVALSYYNMFSPNKTFIMRYFAWQSNSPTISLYAPTIILIIHKNVFINISFTFKKFIIKYKLATTGNNQENSNTIFFQVLGNLVRTYNLK